MARKVLITTSSRWFSVARLALAFGRAGCVVEAVCPPGNPVSLTRVVQASYTYTGLTPLRSLRAAILSSKPDIIVPCDDLTMRQLHCLYDTAIQSGTDASKRLCELIRFSLGDPASYPITESRDEFMALVREEGIQTPEARTVISAKEVEDWIAQHGLPAVLKADGTSGGEGVRIVHTLEDAIRAYRMLHAPLSTLVVAKRTLLDHDRNCILPWLWQRQRSVSIQSFVTGPDANVAIACWQGEILASVSVEVLQTWRPKGPATIIRLIRNDAMLEASGKILRRLKFSGLCGFDFIIDKLTGDALLLEMNARATQTCPLPLGSSRDTVASLCSMLSGKFEQGTPIELRGDTIALFPLAWQGDTSSEIFQSAYHDIPWEEPELVRQGLKQTRDLSRDKWIRVFSKVGLYQR
jgi:hypothetical protein